MPLILITGSGKRLGRGLALEFARNGWDIIIHYYSSEESAKNTLDEINSLGVKAVLIKSDVRNFKEIQASFKLAIDSIGIPDVLINNAGVFPKTKAINLLNEDDWNDVININLRGEYYFSKVFAEFAKSNSKIINIASLGGVEIWKNRIAYNVSKAGVLQLTKALARELAPRIAVNSICPGSISMPLDKSETDSFLTPPNRIPMERHGLIEDIFSAAYFFATCSMFITGQNLIVDGGYNLVKNC